MSPERFTQAWFAASAENFRALLESAPDAIIGVDESGSIVLANSQAEKVFGYAVEELLGKPIETLIPERYRNAHVAERATYTAQPRTRPMGAPGMDLWARRKDGTEFPAEISLSPMQTDRGLLVTTIIRDVTERRRAEQQRVELMLEQAARLQAEAATRRFHDLVQDLEAIVWEFDLHQNRFTFVNRRAEEVLGYKLNDWYANPRFLLEHAHPDDRARVFEFIRALRRGGGQELEFRAMAADGSVLWMRIIVRIVNDANGKPQQFRGLMIDTTARRMTERALRSSEKMAATGRLAAAIAHEINNPMAAVTNVLYLLANHPTLDETAKQYTKLAQDEMSRVAHITRQMLGFYRDTSSPSPLNLPELVDGTIDLYQRQIQRKKVKIMRRYDDSPGVFGYPGEMRQVFSNLLLNALDAVDENGCIKIHISRKTQANGHREGVRITFIDNGSGIGPDHLSQIWEPFFTTKEQHGTGLGLWVTQGIIHKHNGSIRVRSSTREGRSGTCFSIFLPSDTMS